MGLAPHSYDAKAISHKCPELRLPHQPVPIPCARQRPSLRLRQLRLKTVRCSRYVDHRVHERTYLVRAILRNDYHRQSLVDHRTQKQIPQVRSSI